jgi:hypothetical protein
MKRKMSSLVLVGRRWFGRTNGNTYHSCEIIVDGNCVHKIDYAYGYGRQYEDNAKIWLDQSGYLPGREKRDGTPGESLWRYCERHSIIYTNTVTDVQRKKDL